MMRKRYILLRPVFCGFAILSALVASYLTAQPSFSEWALPENVGSVVNSTFNDAAPAVSKDGLSLYFNSDRPAFGANDIYVSRRNSVEEPWGPPENLGAVINTSAFEARPSLSRDGHWLFFNSTRPGGFSPGQDLWASYRENIHDDFGWQPPVNLGPAVNAAGSSEIEPSYFENDEGGVSLIFFGSNRPGGLGAFDIYVTERLLDGTWGSPTPAPGLNSNLVEQSADVRFDGLEIFFSRGTPPGNFDLWVSTRETTSDPWSEPVNLGPLVNNTGPEGAPHIAPDRQTLYFESNRPGSLGGSDLWFTTRTKKNDQ